MEIGQVLSVGSTVKQPNQYWGIHWWWLSAYVDYHTPRMCWVTQFEQAHRPGHFIEVWIDTKMEVSVGGIMCLGGSTCR